MRRSNALAAVRSVRRELLKQELRLVEQSAWRPRKVAHRRVRSLPRQRVPFPLMMELVSNRVEMLDERGRAVKRIAEEGLH